MPPVKPNFQLWNSQVYTAVDALATRPPKQYAANPFFALPSLSVVYGISGSHKTNLMVDLAVCIALGHKWLEGMPGSGVVGFDVAQSPVLWIDQDSGSDALHERFGAMIRAHSGNNKTPIHYLSFPTPPFVAIQAESIDEVATRAKLLKAKFIVLDNLGTISGGKDENSSEMIPVMNNLRYLSQQAGAAVVTIHHDPKNDTGQRKTPRGHSSIEAAIDLALWIKRDQEVVTMTATKTRGAPFDPFNALWTWQHKQGTLTLEKACFYGIGNQQDPKVIQTEQIIIAFLATNPNSSQQDMIIECAKANKKIGRPTVLSVLARMVANGLVKEVRGGKHGAATTYIL